MPLGFPRPPSEIAVAVAIEHLSTALTAISALTPPTPREIAVAVAIEHLITALTAISATHPRGYTHAGEDDATDPAPALD